ncbi:lipoprotein chaperone [bacterium BMS3Bbin14]|nr:lipoprotein chaperone [bacterium BMS3Abin13]GBE53698.1 lipoprotein chaperone [bacterium BMS3Bbin14]
MKVPLAGTVIFVFFLLGLVSAQGTSVVPESSLRLQSVQADFIQETHLKILVRPIISKGRFIFQAPGSLRWEYREPFRSILLMFDGRVRKFIDRDGKLVEERGMQLDAMQVVMGEISGWLNGRFTDNAAFKTSFEDKRTIRLTPKKESLRPFISSIELKLAGQAGLLHSVTIFAGPGAFTKLVFSHVVLNRPVPDALFAKP